MCFCCRRAAKKKLARVSFKCPLLYLFIFVQCDGTHLIQIRKQFIIKTHSGARRDIKQKGGVVRHNGDAHLLLWRELD